MSTHQKPTFLTAEGKAKLEEELRYLKEVRRPEVAEMIRRAREEGDLRENAGYDEAKREQAFVEGRIQQLEELLRHVQVIDEAAKAQGVVTLGSTVVVREEGGPEERFTVVGSAEADPANGRISNESPIGKALLGHKVGDRVEVQTPGGTIVFEVIAIE
nr:transcription elongation factor GreA [Ardenticatena sp.]